MDCIHLSQIRGYGYTGLFAAEQELGQWFEVELWLWLDLELPGHSDNLADTLDYRQIINGVQNLLETSRFQLIERLAMAIIEQVLATSAVSEAQVRLTKLHPPIPQFAGQVSIELRRQRQP
jgi:7,8-dihydroneopterin aldolase/epimerase/oxygenase